METDVILRRILILEDSSDYRKLLLTWLNNIFMDVEIVEYDPQSQGVPGKDFNWSAFNVLLLDYNLSLDNINGLDILQANYSSTMFPSTILLTGAGSEDIAVRAFKYDVSDYLRKEWLDKEKLQIAVENAFIRNTLKRQRLQVLDEIQKRVEEESARISTDLKKKYSHVLELEKKQLQRERQWIEKELEKKQALLDKFEHERALAEKTKLQLLAEMEKLKTQYKAEANNSRIELELETTHQQLERSKIEIANIKQAREQMKAIMEKNQWKQGQKLELELQLEDNLAIFEEGTRIRNRQTIRRSAKEKMDVRDWLSSLKK